MKNIKMKNISMIVGSAILALSATQSFAQNSQIKKEATEIAVVNVPGTLTQTGTPTESSKKVLKGFANDIPLLTVLTQITPNGWIVKKSDTENNKLDVQKRVSWEGGKTLSETLEIIAANHSINISLDWNTKTITLSSAAKQVEVQAKVQAKKSIFELEGTLVKSAGKVEVAQVQVAQAQVVPTAVVSSGSVWEIHTGKTLKENVKEWATKSGYRLVWSGEDYPVTTARILAGEFDAENGPIKQLSVDYGPDSRAQNPLSFQIYDNRTLVVENWMFEQTGFPQFNKKDN